ncbi:derlin-1 isoform X1 [Talpa occidentalis]|uniref:derlin-1 isoform X1 n=1 Tax=Talpa occidentalis TaxID=50954 RepID=UPI0023F99880|nr:derlin-1 isoform X1 [Talpa occidentalis]
MSDIGDWFRSIPAITRYWFAATVAVPLVGKLGLISPTYFFLWPEAFLYRFQIWRPVTATFFFPVGPGTGFLYLVNLYFLYQYSTRLETGAFDGRPADYLFMLLFNWICIVITGLAMDMQLLMIPLIMSVLYVWAQLNRDMIVSFWFGTRFKACYLPWVILGFNYIIGGSVINELIGNLVGHLYFFLMFRYPMDLGGRNFLSTPQFLIPRKDSDWPKVFVPNLAIGNKSECPAHTGYSSSLMNENWDKSRICWSGVCLHRTSQEQMSMR